MPATYTDQAIGGDFDPGAPPPLPAEVTVVSISLYDSDDDGVIEPNGSDQVNGSDVTHVWENDTVTLDGATIVGTTFYTEDGGRYFTPTDGSVLSPGTVTATTFVTTSTEFDVGDLGPPCFVAGTQIDIGGETRAIEEIAVGDRVLTADHGLQPVRWVGRQTVPGHGPLAPVRIRAGALGNRRDLLVSPQHRMLIDGWRAELLFGAAEILCPAVRLCNGGTICRAPCQSVTYVHLMFAEHQIVFAEGAPSESLLVGEYLCAGRSPLRRELDAIFPGLLADPAAAPARILARGYEAQAVAGTI